MNDDNRVVSFSLKNKDKEGVEAINWLKAYSNKRGITMSFLILKAIKNLVNELKFTAKEINDE